MKRLLSAIRFKIVPLYVQIAAFSETNIKKSTIKISIQIYLSRKVEGKLTGDD